MNIELLPVAAIKPYDRNARKIPPEAVRKVSASIQEFGWRQPIVIDRDRVVICGHTRLLAAQQLELERVPVHVAEGLTPEQVRAYRLMDNRSHEETRWNNNLLKLELGELKGFEINMELTGFGFDEIDALLESGETPGLTDEDDAPALSAERVTRPGDLWICGEHRILCGDATVATDVERVLGGELADMVFTDPPYNVDYAQKRKNQQGDRKIKNDNLGLAFEDFLREACINMLMSSRGAVYICMSSSELHTLQRAFLSAGGHWSTFLIWAKQTFTLGRSDYHRQYEPILYGWREGGGHFWCGRRDEADVWFVDKPARNELHPTMKPVELIRRAIRNSSRPGAVVLDLFGGAGSTMIACERTGRRARLVELDPAYVDVAVRRWEAFTGRAAARETRTAAGQKNAPAV